LDAVMLPAILIDPLGAYGYRDIRLAAWDLAAAYSGRVASLRACRRRAAPPVPRALLRAGAACRA